MTKRKITKAFSIYHVKFIVRLLLFLLTAGYCFLWNKEESIFENKIFFGIIWLFLFAVLTQKLFPLKSESIGSRKHFSKYFTPVSEVYEKPKAPYEKRAVLVALVWIAANGVLGVLYKIGLFNSSIMLLITMLYAVGDMVCVIFYCPFQQILGNRCCATCRIYNWDSVMMVTPLIFVKNVWTTALVIIAVATLIRWEYSVHKHTERFSDKTNLSLKCANCPEKYCTRRVKITIPKKGAGKEAIEALKK